jgi:hypothetical protein
MELFNLIATWAGWPIVVAILLIAGGYAGWLQRNRIEQLKEVNETLRLQTKPREALPTGIKITPHADHAHNAAFWRWWLV